jgi:hypothetical protein
MTQPQTKFPGRPSTFGGTPGQQGYFQKFADAGLVDRPALPKQKSWTGHTAGRILQGYSDHLCSRQTPSQRFARIPRFHKSRRRRTPPGSIKSRTIRADLKEIGFSTCPKPHRRQISFPHSRMANRVFHRACGESASPIHRGDARPSPVRALTSPTAGDEIPEDRPYDLSKKFNRRITAIKIRRANAKIGLK